jgi:hypothetical protein
MEALFQGAYLTACQELGLVPEAGEGDAARFAAWADELGAAGDLAGDCRMMVPVFYDVQRRMTKGWAFLGWNSESLWVRFDRPPRVVSCEPARPAAAGPHDRPGVPRRKFRKGPKPARSPELPDVQFTGEQHELSRGRGSSPWGAEPAA